MVIVQKNIKYVSQLAESRRSPDSSSEHHMRSEKLECYYHPEIHKSQWSCLRRLSSHTKSRPPDQNSCKTTGNPPAVKRVVYILSAPKGRNQIYVQQ